MIKEWVLNNFKSIDKETKLDFRPLTIFTGANSSGKSTILQSILLVTQTLQSPISSRSVVLNGWFKKFGSYSDVVNKRDYLKNIHIGFSIQNNGRASMGHYYPWDDGVKTINCCFDLASNNKEDDLQPSLKQLDLVVNIDKEETLYINISKNDQKTKKEQKIIDENTIPVPEADFNYKINTNINSYRGGYYGLKRSSNYIGVGLTHFLPNYALSYYEITERYKEYIKQVLSTKYIYNDLSASEESELFSLLEDKTKEIIEDIKLKNEVKNSNRFNKRFEELKKKFSFENVRSLLEYTILSSDERVERFSKSYDEVFRNLPIKYNIERIPMYFFPGLEYLKSFFNQSIKYLGPLREEPKALYPLEGNDTLTDVGLKGENTAAVYENNKKLKISYVDPSSFSSIENIRLEPKEGTLAEAINKWLVYLCVANEIDTNDRGKMGHELKITIDSGLKQDLTHVGVGVSQILPILVMSFLAEKGNVIILEQPELHLHPKVQTRLADFFVSMNALGKQCIIETHSEYLINRLRYLVAQSSDSRFEDNTMIYFVEKEDGHSNYRPVVMNKYGVIEDWPDGFFDESEKLASSIFKAAMKKRQSDIS